MCKAPEKKNNIQTLKNKRNVAPKTLHECSVMCVCRWLNLFKYKIENTSFLIEFGLK